MSRIGLVAVLVVLTLAPPLAPEMARAEGYPHAQEPIGTVREMYDGALTPDLAVNTFRNIDRLFPTRRIAHGANVWPLPRSDKPFRQVHFQSGGREWDLFDYLAVNRVAGLLILKDGRIAMELYQYGNTERTHWMSMSIAKSVTATLIASALQQKLIGSLDDGLEKYVPRLAGSVYAGVSIRDILMMSSGVRWNETYTDPASDRRRLLEVQIQQRPGAVLELMAGGHRQQLQHRRDADRRRGPARCDPAPALAISVRAHLVEIRDGSGCELVARIGGWHGDRRQRHERHAARLRPLRPVHPG